MPGLAVVAVGGYGRGELSPHSDIDVLFVVALRSEVTQATLRGLLYPLWDAGFQVGHAVVDPKQAIERAASDLESATAVLTARFVAGDRSTFVEFVDRRSRWIAKESKHLVRRILEATRERHRRVDRAGWMLAPDLKEDAGGLRDLNVLAWLASVVGVNWATPALTAALETLLAVREALHAELRRKGDRIRIDLQPNVAARLGLDGEGAVDDLMADVHRAARVVEHEGAIVRDDLAGRVLGGPRRSGTIVRLGDGVLLEDGTLRVVDLVTTTPEAALRLLAAKANTGHAIEARSVEWLTRCFAAPVVETWSHDVRSAFLDILHGPHAAPALELLDHAGGWPVLLPEWSTVRCRAQYDLYHRYTVDGHLFTVVQEVTRAIAHDPLAQTAAGEAAPLDPLYLAALLHDVGKGGSEHHSIAGERIARAACTRIGLTARDADIVCALVRHHLALVDTATRRDLDDGAVISGVADTIGDMRRLRMLYVLSVADGRGTGPGAWSDWKRALVADLYRKVLTALETGALPARSDVAAKAEQIETYEPALSGRTADLLQTLPPSYLSSISVPDMAAEVRLMLDPPALGEVRVRVDEGGAGAHAMVTTCVPDRPGTLARTAGVFALNGMSVLRAQVYSTTTQLALDRFIVQPSQTSSWDRFTDDLTAAYSGRLALEARLERKLAHYRDAVPLQPQVRVLQDASTNSTVVEVRSRDAPGLLWAITAGLSDMDLDIHVAKIDTLGERVVDVFYVRTLRGTKVGDDEAAEVTRAVTHRLERLYGRP